jgi:hypothetical protein
MESWYKSYSKKSLLELQNLLKDNAQLTIQAKIALKKVIENKYEVTEFNEDLFQNLSTSIDLEIFKIESLDYLNKLGIDFYEENGIKFIRKSKIADKRDSWSILIGILLFSSTIPAIQQWIKIFHSEGGIISIIIALILSAIALIGMELLYIAINRIFFYKKFEIINDGGSIQLNYNPNFSLEKEVFSSEAKLRAAEIDKKITLIIDDDKTSVNVLSFKELDFVLLGSLNSMIVKFNN